MSLQRKMDSYQIIQNVLGYSVPLNTGRWRLTFDPDIKNDLPALTYEHSWSALGNLWRGSVVPPQRWELRHSVGCLTAKHSCWRWKKQKGVSQWEALTELAFMNKCQSPQHEEEVKKKCFKKIKVRSMWSENKTFFFKINALLSSS